MRVSRKQVEENKQTILTAAGRLFRERGFDAVTVTDIMKSAGLTHGGFYGYFKSKDDLIAQTLAELKIEIIFPPNIGIILPAAARWRRWRRKPSASPNPRVTK
ncbi:MAG: TetR/AcrR family transcriptional regulator [Klebsiella michiganensis]|nr:TetR/AcrR family transcriptional regulator [Klebsiella michiganensis]